MKRKLLIVSLGILVFACFFAIPAFAAVDYSETATLADGTKLPIYDETHNPLIWYVSGVDAEGNNVYESVPNNRNEGNDNKDAYVTYTSTTGQWAQLTDIYIHIYDSTTEEYIKNSDDNMKIVVLNLRGFDMIYLGNINLNYIQYMYFPSTLKDCPAAFKGKTELRLIDMSVCENLVGGFGGSQNFFGCTNLHTVRLAPGTEYSLSCPNNYNWRFKNTAISSITIPSNVTSLGTDNFYGCTNLKSIYILGNNTSLGKRNFENCTNLENIYILGDSTYITATEFEENFAQCVDGNKTYNFDGIGKYFYFVSTDNNYLTQVKEAIGAISIVSYNDYKANPSNYTEGRYVISGASVCEILYNSEHDLEDVDSCLEKRFCERNCGYAFVPEHSTHVMVKDIVYENGFGQNGEYSCVCANATYCTIENVVEIKNPIITFKGYSVPEKEEKLAINVGYQIDYTLLDEYENVTREAVKLSLFMTNSQTNDNDQNKINISEIFKNDNLDFADGVKGFCVQVNKSSYSSISLTIKGFDKGTNYDGSYYTLKLISAMVVQTTKDTVTNTHYVQATLDTKERIKLHNFDFVIITASAVYKDPIPTV